MKQLNILLFTILTLVVLTSFTSRETPSKAFKIIQSDTKFSDKFCQKAISEANWCGFRYENKRNLIQFETGLKVEFFSMNETNESNPNCTLTDYRDFSNDIWKFTENGKIIHLVSKSITK